MVVLRLGVLGGRIHEVAGGVKGLWDNRFSIMDGIQSCCPLLFTSIRLINHTTFTTSSSADDTSRLSCQDEGIGGRT
jgi:hypothetical protein